MRGKTYMCSACGWSHDEIDVEASVPRGFMAAFSDPAALSEIMKRQSAERVAAAIAKHETECSGRRQAMTSPKGDV